MLPICNIVHCMLFWLMMCGIIGFSNSEDMAYGGRIELVLVLSGANGVADSLKYVLARKIISMIEAPPN